MSMKFMISVDLEGVACAVGAPGQTLTESKQYQMACSYATKEANAAARALFDAGAEEVVIWDNHGAGVNLYYEEFDERCEFLLGYGEEHRWTGLDGSFAGVLLVGYHSMGNTANGILSHTMSNKRQQYVRINGVDVGEITIDAAMAGEMGVPVIFVSTDDIACREVARVLPWAEKAISKKSLGNNLAISKHPARVREGIYQGVLKAVKRISDMRPFVIQGPLTLQIRHTFVETTEQIIKKDRRFTMIDPYTVEIQLERISEYY